MPTQKQLNTTKLACFTGYITQALVINFAPLLFITFTKEFRLSLAEISGLISLTFIVQLITDGVSVRIIDSVGYRPLAVSSHIFASAGLLGLAFFPSVFPTPYTGLAAAVVLYSVGGGLIEVLISPIIEACPFKNKESAMSMLHSFYCWGQMLTVALSTLFFAVRGTKDWRTLACLWAILPFLNAILFIFVPIMKLPEEQSFNRPISLLKNKRMWLFLLLMFCAGASELAMSQWASAFTESALGVSKAVGDLAGPCFFAFSMGLSRLIYAKASKRLNLSAAQIFSSVLCIASYLIAALCTLPAFALIGCRSPRLFRWYNVARNHQQCLRLNTRQRRNVRAAGACRRHRLYRRSRSRRPCLRPHRLRT